MLWICDILVRIRILLFSSVADEQHKKRFFASYFLKVHLHQSSQLKSQKEVTKRINQSFSNFFCLLMDGSGSVQNNDGSGSERPNYIRIRIHYTNRWIPAALRLQS